MTPEHLEAYRAIAWLLVFAFGVVVVWLAATRRRKGDGDVMLSAGDEEQKAEARARRAREYAVKYPTMNGNWNQ